MKKIIIALFALICVSMSTWSFDMISQRDQINSYQFMLDQDGLSIVNILSQPKDDKVQVYQLLERLAKMNQVNLYFSDAENIFQLKEPFTQRLFVIVGDEATLPASCENDNTVCELPMLNKQNSIQLSVLDKQQEVPSSFYVTGQPQQVSDFITAITKQFPKNMVAQSDESDRKAPSAIGLSNMIELFMQQQVWMFTLALLLANVLYFMTQVKVFAIKELHGYTRLRIYAEEMLAILIMMGLVCISGMLISSGYLLISNHDTMQAVLINIKNLLMVTVLFIALYFIVSFPFLYGCCCQKVVEILKRRQRTKVASLAMIFCKVILVSICIVQCSSSLYEFQKAIPNIMHQDVYANKSEGYTKYSLQYTWNQADTETNYQKSVFQVFEDQLHAYSVFDQIALSGNKEVALFDAYGYSVNSNFVTDLQLKDENGNLIQLPKKEIGGYLLVSSTLKAQQAALPQQDNPVLPDDVIYLQENQSIFLFDYQNKQFKDATTKDFILYVSSDVAMYESYYVYVKATPQEMSDALQLAGLPDHLNYESLQDYSNHEVARWSNVAIHTLVQFVVFLLFIIIFIACDIQYYMKSHWKELSVKQLMGFSTIRLYHRKLLQEGILVLLQLALSCFMVYGLQMNGYYREDFPATFVVIVVINFVILMGSLLLRNRYSLQENLKKE